MPEEVQVQETTVVETPAAPAAPAKPETLQDTVTRAVEKSQKRVENATAQPRDNGKFAGPPQFPKPSPSTSTSAPAAPQPPAVAAPQRPEMPQSLKQDLKQYWEQAHPELLADIVRREEDSRKGLEPLRTKAQQADELLAEFKPYEMLMRMENATPKQAIGPLLQTAAILRTGSPVQKAQAVAQTMQQFGISLESVQQMLASGQAQPTVAVDPQLSSLTQQVQQLTQQQQQREEQRALAAITEFSAKPEHKHFEAVAHRILPLLLGMKEDPAMADKSEMERLSLAYETAIWADPEIRKQLLAEQAAQQQAIPDPVAQARQSAVQVSGAPRAAPASKINVQDLHAVVENAIRKQQR